MSQPATIKTIIKKDWTKRWAGSYTFISASYWGKQYKFSLEREFSIGFNHSLFIHRKGTVSFFLIRKELNNFGERLAKQATMDNQAALRWCEELKKNTDIITAVMNRLQGTIPSYQEYKKFLISFDRQLSYHNAIKKTIDFFSVETLNKLLPLFKDARLYSESIYSDTENFFRSIMNTIGRKEKYNSRYLTCLTQSEFETYLQKESLPKEKILKERYQSCLLYFDNGKQKVITGTKINNLEKLIYKAATKGKKEVKGLSAYKGIAVGKVRVVLDPHHIGVFNKGDILVTGMTRPEFLPLLKRASAVITDAGGILCHAAISAREFKIPCIVGTQVATTILKEGDTVQVNADKGTVILINS